MKKFRTSILYCSYFCFFEKLDFNYLSVFIFNIDFINQFFLFNQKFFKIIITNDCITLPMVRETEKKIYFINVKK